MVPAGLSAADRGLTSQLSARLSSTTMLQDLRYTIRLLVTMPLFTVAAILTLALGIGANTAIFTVVNAVMIRPLPFAQPGRLVRVAEKNDKLNLPFFGASVLNYLSWKEQTRALEQLGAIGFASFNLSGRGDPEQLSGSTITPSVLALLGIQPVLGRGFRAGEDLPGSQPVVLISQGLFQRRFGADPALLGRSITLNGIDYTVVGVAPPALTVMTSGDVWIPLTIDPGKEFRLNHVITVIGRLARGVSVQQAQAEMDTIATRVARQFPEVKDWGIHLMTFDRWFVSGQLRHALLVLLGAVTLVLLTACVNVANLLLSRTASRHQEIAIRTAMGAGRGRLIRQLLTESLLLSLLGGATGILAAAWAVRLINSQLPPNLLPIPDVAIDSTVLFFALGITLSTGILFGLTPAWHAVRTDLDTILKQNSRSSTGGGHPLLRKCLVAGELALATMLLIGAALLMQSLSRLQEVKVGFEPHGLLTFQLALPASKYPGVVKSWAFYDQLIQSLDGLPTIRAAAVSSGIPFGAGNYTTTPAGRAGLNPGAAIPIDWRSVSPYFFHAMGIPRLRGRTFTDHDGVGAPPVVVISQQTAKELWGTDDPLGRMLRVVASNKEFQVIGVVGDVRNTALNLAPDAAMYFSASARLWPLMDVVVRTQGDPLASLTSIRQRVRALDTELPMSNVRTMDGWISGNAAQPRLNAALIGTFAVIAVIIAAIGIYGVISFSVAQRTQEIGLRIALGAQRSNVLRLIVLDGSKVIAVGIIAGLAGALVLSRVLAALLFGVEVRDPVTFALVALLLLFVALSACYIPARRATRIDPASTLR